jgi:uncharacterized membrane protein SirB2
MTVYWFLKVSHVGAVVVSGALFALRGWWMLRNPGELNAKWVRVVPHVVDTVLLASAIALAVMTAQYPLQQSWLTAKLLGLILYIALGSIALKRGRTLAVRSVALAAALATFGYIVGVALTRTPALVH